MKAEVGQKKAERVGPVRRNLNGLRPVRRNPVSMWLDGAGASKTGTWKNVRLDAAGSRQFEEYELDRDPPYCCRSDPFSTADCDSSGVQPPSEAHRIQDPQTPLPKQGAVFAGMAEGKRRFPRMLRRSDL